MREWSGGSPPSAATAPARAAVAMTWPPDLPFAAVLAGARTGDTVAVARLYKRFLPTVYRYALARVADSATAEDLTSDTFFAMLESIGSARAQDELAFAAWLLGIARNKVAMHFRRRQAAPTALWVPAEEDEPPATAEEDDPLAVITARESWGEVLAALDRLTEEQRNVVLYRCVLGYSADEVARLMGKQPGTVRALQFRALGSLARHLGLDARAKGGDHAARG